MVIITEAPSAIPQLGRAHPKQATHLPPEISRRSPRDAPEPPKGKMPYCSIRGPDASSISRPSITSRHADYCLTRDFHSAWPLNLSLFKGTLITDLLQRQATLIVLSCQKLAVRHSTDSHKRPSMDYSWKKEKNNRKKHVQPRPRVTHLPKTT